MAESTETVSLKEFQLHDKDTGSCTTKTPAARMCRSHF